MGSCHLATKAKFVIMEVLSSFALLLISTVNANSFPNKELFQQSLNINGSYVFGNIGKEYATALKNLRLKAPNCLDESLRIFLEDGSTRSTIARSSFNLSFPKCIDKDVQTILYHFDKVDNYMVKFLDETYGEETFLNYDGHLLGLRGLPYKSHVHVYERGSDSGTSAQESLSFPYHTDNGLYLLLTPSDVSPLMIKHRDGSTHKMDVSDDSIIMLLGTGLTSWLLPNHHLFAAPHAVPSLAPLAIRTVLATMKVAPNSARNIKTHMTFADHFYSSLRNEVKTTFEARHLQRMKRQVSNDHSQHWIGQIDTNSTDNNN